MGTDPTGRFDLPDHPLTRLYLLSSAQHASAGNPTTKGACQQFLNPLDPAPVERALWTALDEWSTRGMPPPDSEIPTLRKHTLVSPLPQSAVGFPHIPGVTYTGLKTTRYRFNYGPNFYQTFIPTINPPVHSPPFEDNPTNGPIYPAMCPRPTVTATTSPALGCRNCGCHWPPIGLGAALRCLGKRRMRRLRPIHPVSGNASGARRRGRSAAFGTGAVCFVQSVSESSCCSGR
jgi:hypothetical protein